MSIVSTLVSRPRADRPALPEGRVTVDGEDVRYVDVGSGPVLVLLHGHEQEATSLLVWGAWDLVLPAHHARAAARRLPRARVAIFPACGHLPHVEQPDRFVAELRTLLAQPLDRRHHAA